MGSQSLAEQKRSTRLSVHPSLLFQSPSCLHWLSFFSSIAQFLSIFSIFLVLCTDLDLIVKVVKILSMNPFVTLVFLIVNIESVPFCHGIVGEVFYVGLVS